MPRFTEKQFQAENDMRILKDADEVRASPSRMKAAKAMANKEVKALTKVTKGKK